MPSKRLCRKREQNLNQNSAKTRQDAKKTWKTDFDLPVGVSLSTQRQVEVMTAKIGSTPERNISFPCERHIQHYDAEIFRGESIGTAADEAFRILQQVITAEGKDQTPSRIKLNRSVDTLELDPGQQVTIRLHFSGVLARSITEAVATFLVVPRSGASCRLLVKALVRYRSGWAAWLRPGARTALTHLFRRDLLEIKRLAESAR
jgi:hypothetical protein